MSLIDELNIHATAGRGGDGVVRWRQEKFIPKGGPAGGDGGRGGDFYIKGVRDIGILVRYKSKKNFQAENGGAGGNKSLHGKNGEDFVLELPIGSVVTNINTGERWELLEDGDKFLILRGGYGGYGNEHFKSSTNTTPQEANKGAPGEEGDFHIELRIFADMGLVGYPNAGKSSLLNMITKANAKVGDYAFTTLDPNLGDFYGYIIADIPGIIEGASEGKGLGIKFLKHIKRTKILAHLISFENPNMLKAYKEIRKELESFDKKNQNIDDETEDNLTDKEEIIILTKTDIVENQKAVEKAKKDFAKLGKKVLLLSLYDDDSIKNLKDELIKILKKK